MTAQPGSLSPSRPLAPRGGGLATVRALVELSRPHTIIGTTLACTVLYLLAAAAAHRHDLALLAEVLGASLCVNLYIVALNQLTDIDIDKINKPWLPLAAGTLRPATVAVLVAVSGAAALVVAGAVGRTLFATIATIFAIGTAYSVPPFRWKRLPFFAAASITVARALVLNIGVYLTYSGALAGRASLPPEILLFVAFLFGFVVVIALMKDIPDVEGDQQSRIATLVLRLGPARTLRLCQLILTVCYLGVIAAALAGVGHLQRALVVTCHLGALAAVWGLGARVAAGDKGAVYRYYMFIWKLFYFEFVAFPVSILLG